MTEKYHDQEPGKESEAFLQSLRNGDEEAWTWLYKRYRSIIYGYFYSRIRRLYVPDADVLAQTVFEKLLRSKNILGTKGTLLNYVFLLSHNEYVNFILPILRRLKKGVVEEESLETHRDKDLRFISDEDLEGSAEKQSSYEVLIGFLQENLSEEEFSIILRHYVYGETNEEIAKSLGQVRGTVENRVVRIRKKIKQLVLESEELRDLLSDL